MALCHLPVHRPLVPMIRLPGHLVHLPPALPHSGVRQTELLQLIFLPLFPCPHLPHHSPPKRVQRLSCRPSPSFSAVSSQLPLGCKGQVEDVEGQQMDLQSSLVGVSAHLRSMKYGCFANRRMLYHKCKAFITALPFCHSPWGYFLPLKQSN